MSSVLATDEARSYRMTRRAESVAQTRRRIVEATVRLHGSVGPAATSVSAIADEAGVTRLTVYRHFPDLGSLFAGCTAHWLAGLSHRPDPESWLRHADPATRLEAALTDLYAFYREGESMLSRVHRDLDALPESHRQAVVEQEGALARTVLDAWPRPARTATRRALVAHAIAFSTWQSLCDRQGLSDARAVIAMCRLVTTA